MRIAMIIEAWKPIWGGGQVHVYELCKRLVKYGVEIDLYVMALKDKEGNIYNEDEELFDGKLRIIRLGIPKRWEDITVFDRIYWAILTMIATIRNHRRKKYNIIHAHAYFPGIPGKILSKLLNIPVVYTVHGANNLELGSNTMLAKFENFLLTRIKYDLQITVSKKFFRYSNVNQLIYLPNGVSLDDVSKCLVRKHDYFVFLYVGRFDYVKGVDILLKAVHKIKEELIKNNAKIKLVGYGYDEEWLKKLASELNLNGIVEFVGKKLGKDLIMEYCSSDVFVLPSRSEGFPLTILEAWASKLPVIATEVGENPYLVKHRYNGWLVKPEDVEELAEVLKGVLNTPRRKLEIMGERGYWLVRSRYSWEYVANKLLSIYHKLLMRWKNVK